ncbi:MAG TPA: hypothetical protein DCQ06_14710 [Myxococcales bacterium]|nr:hypothetical protein [Myxococcales bacterium]HAN32843.1 hypothetical protein [Myxococcales bacterium]
MSNREGRKGGHRGRRGGHRGRRGPRGSGRGAVLPLPEGIQRFAKAWTVVLTPSTLNLVTAGHPWLYSGAVAHTLPPLDSAAAESAIQCGVFGPDGEAIGHGVLNQKSQIRVRILALWPKAIETPTIPSLAEHVTSAMQRAHALREAFGLPAPQTDAMRLVNSEGDGLPGLVVDQMSDGAVVLVSTAAAAQMASTVERWLVEHGAKWVVIRSAGDTHPSEELAPGVISQSGQVPSEVWIEHHGLKLRAEPLGGQKSGLYTDQFANHVHVAQLCRDRNILDCYSHGGGFGLHAARAGAKAVRCVDASQKAVDLCSANAERNDLTQQVQAWCADAVHVLSDIADGVDPNRPDLIIIDPPKFATRADVVDDALRKYVHLNATAMSALPDGGILVTCSCSGRIDQTHFVRMIAHAARKAGRHVQLLELRGPAADHPSAPAHGESRYLKVAICRVTSR